MKPRGRAAAIPAAVAGERHLAIQPLLLLRRFVADDARATVFAAAMGAAIVVLAGVPLAAALNIWTDEAFTLHTTGAGPAYAWAQAITFETQPPLYFLLEAAWRTFNESSIAFARLPSVAFAAAAVAIIVFAARRLAPRVPPLAVALTMALNPLVIWAATEMRVYPLVFLVGAVLTWTFFEGFLAPQTSGSARCAYVAFAIIGLYTQYYVGFVLVAHALTLIAQRRGALRGFAVAMAIVACAFAPFLPIVMQHLHASGEFVSRVSFVAVVHEIANAVFVFLLPHDITWSGLTKLAGFGLAAMLVAALFVFGRPAITDRPARSVLTQWLLCLAIFALLFVASGVPLDLARHIIVVAPSTLLVAYLVISSLTRRQALGANVALAVFAVFSVTMLWAQYHPPLAKQGDWRRVAATVSADRDTPVAVFPAEFALPLTWYLPVAPIEIPHPMPFTADYVHATTLTAESDVARAIGPLKTRSRRLWIVTSGACPPAKADPFDYHCGYLEAYVKRRYHLVRSVAFRGTLARLYERLPDLAPALPVRQNANEALSR